MEEERYKHLNKYLKEKFGERTLKICIDGGFTCPNRDGTLSTSGCIFCSEKGSGELIRCGSGDTITEKISNQVKNYFNSTYDSLDMLKSKYDAALIDDRIVGLEVATRPDCINKDIVDLLKSYKDKYYVCVELGLQTYNDETGTLINRGYSSCQFTNAVKLLNEANIDIVAHIMVGLPGESFDDLKDTVDFINMHNIQGLKIHSTYVVKNTALADMFFAGCYEPISFEYYLDALTYVVTHISPNVVIHRISGDAPKDLLVAPEWNLHKKWVLNGFDKILREQDLWQGKYYKA